MFKLIRKLFRLIRKLIKHAILLIIIALAVSFGVTKSVEDNIKFEDELSSKADCILILGCGIRDEETPSDMLRDRLDKGIELYQAGVSDKILVSGDNGQEEYNEVHVMLHYLLNKKIPARDIFCDHAGFSTYDSIYRSNSIFGAKNIIVISQKYHLYRALFIAKKLGINAEGVPANFHLYSGTAYREIREILARDKDFIKSNLKLSPKYEGEQIPLNGDSKDSWEQSEL